MPHAHPGSLVGALALSALSSVSAQQSPRYEPQRLRSDGSVQDAAQAGLRVLPRSKAAFSGATETADHASSGAARLRFANGEHAPTADERVDPALLALAGATPSDERAADELYAYLIAHERVQHESAARLANLGLRWLGRHGERSYLVALPRTSLSAVAADPALRWIGLARAEHKLAPSVAATRTAQGELHVWISTAERESARDVFALESQATVASGRGGEAGEAARPAGALRTSRGWQARALAQRGARIESYAPGASAFRARVPAERVLELAALDFVLALEPVLSITPFHDESTPLIGADHTRGLYPGNGFGGALAAMVDSGMWAAHEALTHVHWIVYDLAGTGYTEDESNHGTGVAHTILGQPPLYNSQHRGVAPALGDAPSARFRVVRGSTVDPEDPIPADYEEFFDLLEDAYMDDGGFVSPPPHVINFSNGVDLGPTGTSVYSRMVDAGVYEQDQMAVFAVGNSGPGEGTVKEPGAAKNAFGVGGVEVLIAPGTSALSSSRGPTKDGRIKPNVCAPFRTDWAQAETTQKYENATGTSIAAPHVTGLVAQLVDHHPSLAYRPARMASLLMATATSFADDPHDALHEAYGLGRVDALRAHGLDPRSEWLSDSVELDAGDGAFADFTIDKDCARMIVVLHYVEPAGLPGAERAILNDYDLWLDREPLSAALDAGEFKSLSRVDNTEFIVVDNPGMGTWRWKAHAFDVLPFLGGTVKIGVTVHQLRTLSASTSLQLVSPDTFLRPGELGALYATVSNSGRVASALLATATESKNKLPSFAFGELLDGAEAEYHTNPKAGAEVCLGNLGHGDQRLADWTWIWQDEGSYLTGISVDGDNTSSQHKWMNFIVDGTPPGAPSMLSSPTHAIAVWSKNPVVGLQWTAAPDNLSGIEGYAVKSFTGNASLPPPPKAIGAVTSTNVTLPSSSLSQTIALRALDKSWNWSQTYASAGPFKIDAVAPNLTVVAPPVTNQPAVVFTLNASDAHSGLHQMRHRVNNGAWSAWTAFASSKVLVFQQGTQNNVTFEVRDHATNVKSASAIVLVY